jgi:hypothetical protein
MIINCQLLVVIRRLLRPGIFLYVFMLFSLASCFQQNVVEEHFRAHGMSYPVDFSGMTLWDIEFSGIEEAELLEPGAKEFVDVGIKFAKEYFKRQDAGSLMPGVSAIAVNNPVLFRDDLGEVGLMIRVTGYGAGKPNNKVKLSVDWVGSDKRLWRVENFAYFSRNDLYQWQYDGLVY